MGIHDLIDFVLHIDKHLESIIGTYQTASYAILCLIIFCETGLVATPFLPGDSLLFATGAIIASTQTLNIWVLIPLLFASALLGDNVNYFVGKYVGHKVFEIKFLSKIIKREYLDRTHDFYEKHGGKAIVIARFLPIIRTFAPFVAGLGEMSYKRYITFCVIGGLLWVNLLTLSGYFLGSNEFVKHNFEVVVILLIVIPAMPAMIAYFSSLLNSRKNKQSSDE